MDEHAYYSAPGKHTDLSRHAPLVDHLPTDPAGLCEVVQGLILHPFWTQAYDVELTPDRGPELQLRRADEMVDRIVELDDSPLHMARDPQRRLVGNCRDFTTLSVAILRHHGVAARARAGFGTYFTPGKYIDHWVVEIHNDDGTWRRFDSQLDELQRSYLKVGFDVLDMPGGTFLDGAEAWQLIRRGEADGDDFGILNLFGIHFARGDLALDLAALNKVELLPWDTWGLNVSQQPPEETDAVRDTVAEVTTRGRLDQIRELYENDDRLRVPDEVVSWLPEGPVTVRL